TLFGAREIASDGVLHILQRCRVPMAGSPIYHKLTLFFSSQHGVVVVWSIKILQEGTENVARALISVFSAGNGTNFTSRIWVAKKFIDIRCDISPAAGHWGLPDDPFS